MFLKGIGYGLMLAMLIGPVFFALIRTSIDKGFVSGAYLALGIALSDAFAVTSVYFGIAQFVDNPIFQKTLGLVGGLMMLGFGSVPFLKPVSQKPYLPERAVKRTQGVRYVLEGIFLNILNPFVYLFWLTIVSSITMGNRYSSEQLFVFFFAIILTVLCTDLSKVYVANRITNYLTVQVISVIDRVAGIALILFGIRLLYFGVYGV